MSNPSPLPSVAIIGGGLAGTSVAIRLLRGARTPLAVHLVDPQAFPGRGIAYSSRETGHRLNAAALRHIIRADDPDHFPRWLAQHAPHPGWPKPDDLTYADAYPPRWLFGAYIEAELRDAIATVEPGVTFHHHRDVARDLARSADGLIITTSASTLTTDHVVLAPGLFTPKARFAVDPALADDPAFLGGPWDQARFTKLPREGHIAILGSHLTMMDTLVSLERHGFRGTLSVFSRHGLSPGPSYMGPAWRDFLADGLPTTTRALLRRLRVAHAEAAAEGIGWQAVMAAIRPHIATLWRNAPLTEQRRFERHLRSRTLGHSAPPQAFDALTRIKAEGRYRIHAARIVRIDRTPAGIAVQYRARGADDISTETVDAVIDCTGHDHDWRRIDDPLIRNLLRRGLVRAHALGSGIDGDASGRVANSDGTLAEDLSACGHPFHGGVFYESSASSALREQSTAVAERLLRHFAQATIATLQGETA